MCGIAGIFDKQNRARPEPEELARMIRTLGHRGPDGFGLYTKGPIGLAHARLSIIDLEGGTQPMTNETGDIWLTYNGEVYNYLELREELEQAGHRFRTQSDSEVLIHGYEEWGDGFVARLNGNFALGIWDEKRDRLLLARDRLGIRPLYWAEVGSRLLFASELCALLAGGASQDFDLAGLDQVFVTWTTAAPRTILRGVSELPPGYLLVAEGASSPRTHRYWDLPDPPEDGAWLGDVDRAAEELRALLEDSVKLRLRADVPVGAYLSGGLDSTAAVALVRQVTETELETFSIAFADRDYDERPEQEDAARHLGTRHHVLEITYDSIAEAFSDAVIRAERPILRTAPVPLFLLSGMVRDHGMKVVLTGEGADEILGGYDIFKETKIRAWWARRPDSTMRPALLRKLYPFAPGSGSRAAAFFEAFYREGIDDPEDPGFSHRPTWKNGLYGRAFYSPSWRREIDGEDPSEALLGPWAAALDKRGPLARAEYIETKHFLPGYLLASQGDRMSLGHGVEGRYPFLDHRIVEWGTRLDPALKLFGLSEKWILRRALADLLPESVLRRPKRPYTAPNIRTFAQGIGLEVAQTYLGDTSLEATGLFDPARVGKLRDRALASRRLGERENMAFVGILSCQILANEWAGRAWGSSAEVDLAEFPVQGVPGDSPKPPENRGSKAFAAKGR